MPLAPGVRVGPYEVLSSLGSGGMGEVYRAHDSTLNREVALKVLPDAVARDPDRLARFRREARALASLNHPNIAVIHGLAESDEVRALVLELVEGPTLADRVAQGALPMDQVLAIAQQIAAALVAAHDRGIVHRDLKPANIKVRPDGTVKLLDFGLAKLEASPESETVTTDDIPTEYGTVMGTPPYMSPEQWRGGPVDARSDLFSFGAVLYETATGHRAFPAHFDRTPPPMQALPPELRQIVDKLLKADPDGRYQSATDLSTDLERLQRGGRVEVGRRHVWALAGAVLLLLIGGATLFLWRDRADPVRSAADYTQITDLAESARSPSLSPDGRMVTFKVGENFFLGDGQVYVKLLPNGESVRLTSGSPKYGPVFTPDGARVTYTQLDSTPTGLSWDTWIVPVLGGEPTRLLPNASGLTWIGDGRVLFAEIRSGLHMGIVSASERRSDAREIYFPQHQLGMAHFAYASPDRQSLLVVEMDQTHAFGLPCRLVPAGGGSTGRAVGPRGTCTSAAWSPDGQWMYFSAVVGGRSHLWRQRYADGTPEQITVGPTEEEGVTVAPDGRSLVTSLGIRRSSIWIHDAAGERAIVSEGYARVPRMSRDGTRVFFLLRPNADSGGAELRALELGSGTSHVVLPGVSVIDYEISSDETEAAFTAQDSAGESQVWIASLDRRIPPRLIARNADQVSFGPDADLIFRSLQAPANTLVRIGKDGSRRQPIDGPTFHEKRDVSPDGKWVIVHSPGSGSTDPVATLAVPVGGGPARRLCVPYCAVGWSADGRLFTMGVELDLATGSPSRTLVLPLREGTSLPDLPASGVHAIFGLADLAKQPGVRVLDHAPVSLARDPAAYVFTRAEFHTNLFRIRLQR